MNAKAHLRRRGGQAMVESIFVLILAILCFLAVFQYADLFAAKAVLEHAAARAARSRAVGFNHFMVEKSARVAAIPASGRRLAPGPAGIDPGIAKALASGNIGKLWDLALTSDARSPGARIERSRVPDYMDSINAPTAAHILDYELWDKLSVEIDDPMNLGGGTPGTLTVALRLRRPLLISLKPLARGELRGAEEDEGFTLGGAYTLESHYPLYMEDRNW